MNLYKGCTFMKLQNVFGNTYFVKGGTNTGVYLFKNNEALLIDPGLNGLRPKNMIKMFENEKIIPKYIINTHEHEDHVAACGQIKHHLLSVFRYLLEYALLNL